MRWTSHASSRTAPSLSRRYKKYLHLHDNGLKINSFSSQTPPPPASSLSSALVVGGAGALGRACVEKFKEQGWHSISVDLQVNDNADENFQLPHLDEGEASWMKTVDTIAAELDTRRRRQLDGAAGTQQPPSLRAVVVAAGGWAGGDAHESGFLESVMFMWRCNALSAAAGATLASFGLPLPSSHPTREGAHLPATLVFTGAAAARGGSATPGMLGYGMAKAATHQLASSLRVLASSVADKETEELQEEQGIVGEGKEEPYCGIIGTGRTTVLAVLPQTIDTPANREGMPGADFSSWTRPEAIATAIGQFCDTREGPITVAEKEALLAGERRGSENGDGGTAPWMISVETEGGVDRWHASSS